MKLGNLEFQIVSGGRFWADGGNMFGVVPRVVWQRLRPPDEFHRVLLETNCLICRIAGKLVLMDTGYGQRTDKRMCENYSLEGGHPLLRNMAAVGIAPQEVDVVVLTHLHFDHVGGATVTDESGRVRPAFPRARYFVQQAEWEDAAADRPELVGAYFRKDFELLEAEGVLEKIVGEAEILPGLRVQQTGGHTRGQQIVWVGQDAQKVVYTTDLCPSSDHLRAFWNMAYDQFPLEQRRIKPRILGRIADEGHVIVFDHDPKVKAATLARDPKQEFVIREIVDSVWADDR